jgi:hypothetical protein
MDEFGELGPLDAQLVRKGTTVQILSVKVL